MKIYRVVYRQSGLDEWEPVPGGGLYKSAAIAKGQKTRLENDMKRLYGSYRYENRAYSVQVAEITDWVTML